MAKEISDEDKALFRRTVAGVKQLKDKRSKQPIVVYLGV